MRRTVCVVAGVEGVDLSSDGWSGSEGGKRVGKDGRGRKGRRRRGGSAYLYQRRI